MAVAKVAGTTNNRALNVLNKAATTIPKVANSALQNYMSYANQGSAMANAVSAQAQAEQMAFNANQAEIARNYNQAMWEQTSAFNAEEAQKNREWQERMSNTAYQRAVEDLKKAGLNPVLAALNGGASTGSGAAAGMTGLGSPEANSSNYTGQGHNMSEQLAMFGAIAQMLGQGLSAFSEYASSNSIDKKIENFIDSIFYDKKYTEQHANESRYYSFANDALKWRKPI